VVLVAAAELDLSAAINSDAAIIEKVGYAIITAFAAAGQSAYVVGASGCTFGDPTARYRLELRVRSKSGHLQPPFMRGTAWFPNAVLEVYVAPARKR
jgi:hypothetical protein